MHETSTASVSFRYLIATLKWSSRHFDGVLNSVLLYQSIINHLYWPTNKFHLGYTHSEMTLFYLLLFYYYYLDPDLRSNEIKLKVIKSN